MPSPACPHCESDDTARSRRRGFVETTVLPLLGRAPFRCRSCRKRFVARWKNPSPYSTPILLAVALGLLLLVIAAFLVAIYYALDIRDVSNGLLDWMGPPSRGGG